MSSNETIMIGYPNGYGQAGAARRRALRDRLEDGIDEMKRVHRESTRSDLPNVGRTSNVQVLATEQVSGPARRSQPRTSTSHLLAYAQIADSAQESARRALSAGLQKPSGRDQRADDLSRPGDA